MSKIFISYAYADGADIARQLVAELEAAGSPCWIGQRDMKTGEDFPPQIVRAIRECQALVVLLTPKANGSRDVLQEVSLAHNAQKPMVPLIVRNTTPSDGLAYYLAIVQQVAWSDARAAAAAVRTVLTGGAVGRVAAAGATAVSIRWLRAWLVILVAGNAFGISSPRVFRIIQFILSGHLPRTWHLLFLALVGFASLANLVFAILVWNWRRLGLWGFISSTIVASISIINAELGDLFYFATALIAGPMILALLVRPHWARFK